MIKKEGNIVWKILKKGKIYLQLPIELYRELRTLLRQWYMIYDHDYWKEYFPTIWSFFMKEMTTPLEVDLENETRQRRYETNRRDASIRT